MKATEKVLGVLALLELIMKFLLIPGHGIMIVVAHLLLASLYGLLGFALFNNIPFNGIFKRTSYSGITPSKIVGTIGLGIALANIVIGVLFKFQFYEGALLHLLSGLFLLSIVLFVAIIRYPKHRTGFYRNIFIRAGIIGGIGIVVLFTPQDWLMKVTHPNYPDQQEQMEETP